MGNRFGIPPEIEAATRARDVLCVYCWRKMQPHVGVRGAPPDKATIEHLDHRPPFHWKYGLRADGIVICCASCNASRGAKTHAVWFSTSYCIERGITAASVAAPVRDFLVAMGAQTNRLSLEALPPSP